MTTQTGRLMAVLSAGMVSMLGVDVTQAQDATYTTDAYVYLVWTQTGVTNAWQPSVDMPVEVLVIGGGGSGGNGLGGGGGAGGVVFQPIALLGGTNYSIYVGRGGGASTVNRIAGLNGENSFFDTLVAYGGGGGGAWTTSDQTGRSGGSGGGSANTTRSSGVSGQGSAGGIFNGNYRTGGGGGYSQQGQDGIAVSPVKGGDGGDGIDLSGWLDGVSLGDGGWFAGGGGGTDYQSDRIGYGGRGGGGDGGRFTANVGAAANGTGGGGGAAGDNSQVSGKGGDGIVIVRYARIVNLPVDARTDTTVALRGSLLSTDSTATTVYVVWGTHNWATNMADWVEHGTVIDLGGKSEGDAWTNTLSDLAPNTIYWFNHVASNEHWVSWAAEDAAWVKTLGPPSVDNADGATSVGVSMAMLNGTLLDGAPADVCINVWADGSDETNRFDLGSRELGTFAYTASELAPSTRYHYRGYVSNAYGTAWADASASFTTLAADFTSGQVEWVFGAGQDVPYWDVPANWVETISGLNKAPANPTTATLRLGPHIGAGGSYDTERYVAGTLTADSVIGHLRPLTGMWVGFAHALDLNGKTLQVNGNVGVNQCCNGYLLTLNSGTLQVGSETIAGGLLFAGNHSPHRLIFGENMLLQTFTNTTIRGSLGGNASIGEIDLRGAEIVGGRLKARHIYLSEGATGGGHYCRIMLDGSTSVDAIQVISDLQLTGQSYIGDPATHKLPPNLDFSVGIDAVQRGLMDIGGANRTTEFSATSGGTFTAYLTTLRIPNSNIAASQGILDLATMNGALIDTLELRIGTDRAAPGAFDNQRGRLRLPSGSVLTAGTAVIGGETVGTAVLDLVEADFVVTDTITLHPTAWITNRVATTPLGLDIEGALVDNGGHIHISFTEAPTEDIHWGVRVQGSGAAAVLGGMVGSGRLTWDYDDEAIPGKKVGVVTDSEYAYLALVDEETPLNPIAAARDELIFEMEPDGTVTVSISEVDVGSYDPDERPFTLTISEGGRESATSLDFTDFTDYTVTLTITANGSSDSDTCTVRIVPIPAAVTGNVRWSGGAPTALMDRREWMWGGNWLNGVPPANPTAATIEFFTLGQHVGSKLDQDRTVGNLSTLAGAHQSPTPTHVVDLNGHTLTVEGFLGGNSCCYNWRFTLTNGTLRVGSPGKPGRLLFGGNHRDQTLILAPGTRLESANLSEIRSNSSSSHADNLVMRGVVWGEAVLRVGEINVTAGTTTGIVLDETVAGNTVEILTRLLLGGGTTYIGDSTAQNLPSSMNLTFGQNDGARAELLINPGGRLVASGGGALSGWVSALDVGVGASGTGRLQLEAMASCDIEAQTVRVGVQNNAIGVMSLPPGDATFGTLELGSTTTGAGTLTLNRTRMQVGTSVTLNHTGALTIDIGSEAAGMELTNTDPGALTLSGSATITLNFTTPPDELPHYGLRWEGNHVTTLGGYEVGGRLVINDAGLAGRQAEIFLSQGATYIGLPPPPGSLFLLR